MKHTIDAKDQKIGRVATEAASVLMGKNRSDFTRNKFPEIEVEVINASQMAITEKKKDEKEYPYYSGYPGGLRFEKLSHTLNKKGVSEVLRKAVFGMLPKNKLRSRMIQNLKVVE